MAYEVANLLRQSEIAHAFIEGDFLDHVHPAPEGDPHRTQITARNLAAVWANYREVGQRRLVYCNTVAVLEADMITGAMGGPVTAVGALLTATDATATARLGARETGSELESHLERSARAAEFLDRKTPDWVHRVATDDRTVREVAEDVLARTTWTGA
ncbi:hypothetical protein AB0B28_16950 [Glycomyces sp. NPDC046736]|uniref:hypothetical protein n=1 Tax=Glycomyces sp. NPDC046736 TaxID=3155615 RepID=UPI003404E7BF